MSRHFYYDYGGQPPQQAEAQADEEYFYSYELAPAPTRSGRSSASTGQKGRYVEAALYAIGDKPKSRRAGSTSASCSAKSHKTTQPYPQMVVVRPAPPRLRPRLLVHPMVQLFMLALLCCLALVALLVAGVKLPEPLPLLPVLLFSILALSMLACLLFVLLWMVNWFFSEQHARRQPSPQQAAPAPASPLETEPNQPGAGALSLAKKKGYSSTTTTAATASTSAGAVGRSGEAQVGSLGASEVEPEYPWANPDPFATTKFFVVDRTGASSAQLDAASWQLTQTHTQPTPSPFAHRVRREALEKHLGHSLAQPQPRPDAAQAQTQLHEGK